MIAWLATLVPLVLLILMLIVVVAAVVAFVVLRKKNRQWKKRTELSCKAPPFFSVKKNF